MPATKQIVFLLSIISLSPLAQTESKSTECLSELTAPITVSTRINSSAEKVWDLMMDFSSYGTWNGWVDRVDGDASVGSTVTAKLRDSFIELDLQITEMERPYNLCWTDVSKFTCLGVGGWRCRFITPLEDGSGVLLTNHFEFTGPFKLLISRSEKPEQT